MTTHKRYWPFGQLLLARLREFYREPEVLFWVYGFPILMTLGLGIAFRDKPVENIHVAIEAGPLAEATQNHLAAKPTFLVIIEEADACRQRLRVGKVDLIIRPSTSATLTYEFLFDPTRPESVLARRAVEDALQRAAGRSDPAKVTDHELTEPGGRYIDFLVPGLVGMALMGGGLWGVGFVTVDMRIRKLLKRFLATPMKRHDFLLAIMASRMIFMIPEVAITFFFSWLAFGVIIRGSLWTLAFFVLLGSTTFSGIGLLVASRAKTLETVSGLMNLVMLPMWMLSGIFFSSERFPDAVQPLIQILPLTPLIAALRAITLEGATFVSLAPQAGVLIAWASISFVLALMRFRWN